LVRAGAFDELNSNRAQLLANIGLALENAEQQAANANQGGLFDMVEDAIEPLQMTEVKPWTLAQKLAEEKQAIGFYFSGHPFEPYANKVRALVSCKLSALKPSNNKQKVAGFVTSVRYIVGKRGKFAVVLLEDGNTKQEVVVAGQVLEEFGHYLKADQVLVMECKVAVDEYNGGEGLRITADNAFTLTEASARSARSLYLHVAADTSIDQLAAILQPYREQAKAHIPIKFCCENSNAYGELSAPASWLINLDGQLLESLHKLVGEEAVQVHF
jgi:DNA polymerase III subunit alpha